ncbi:hypothetical protein DCAR_0520384 [Daucus carota subsp. sativus]|uniref:Uncharacterized protein n=1 Tax=Daucus carota subsp. sativus TaxID=79200 RepID=A0AAF0X738_DAUCS|nr:PREDICTED: uncharacterized protein LOC108223267 [Daucus carota subsp. sativus]WOH01006.1 hypothetical protein DCAR_0520384 [Daucus carota subsp. sativus]
MYLEDLAALFVSDMSLCWFWASFYPELEFLILIFLVRLHNSESFNVSSKLQVCCILELFVSESCWVIGEASFQSSVLSASPGSCCIAPKSGSCKKAAQQMDTYSFGVMLFELVTGRRADEHIESGDGEFLDISQTHRPNKQYYEL